jgi:PAS domain S-box-containing protein
MEAIKRRQHRLSVQIVITLVGLVLLTASAVGIPSVWILRSQLERQAWALVNQGSQTSLAILSNKQGRLTNLAIVTAQRPTLRSLVEAGNREELEPYLQVLQEGAGLDLLLLCSHGQEMLIAVGKPVNPEVCLYLDHLFFFEDNSSGASQVWLFASQLVEAGEMRTDVVVGNLLDDQFAAELHRESGLEQVLLFQGRYTASSFQDGREVWETVSSQRTNTTLTDAAIPFQEATLISNDTLYYANRVPISSGFELVVSKPITEVLGARRQMTWALGAGIIGVILLGSALGIARSRRISQPLERLKEAADDLRKGRLSNPIRVDSQIQEVALLSFALEDARIAIVHSMKELHQEKAWTEHLLESVVEGIVTIDKRRLITFFSHGAEEITGWKQDQVLGRSIDELFKLVDEDEYFSQRMPAPGSKNKIVVRLKSGKPATLAVTGARLNPPEAGKGDIALVLRDVSNEEVIRRLLGEFLANISHEFRTPLSALSASIELLLDQLPDLEQQELEELLNSIHLGTLSLQHLIDNLLEGASIETGRFAVSARSTSIIKIVEEAAGLIQPLVEKYHLVLQRDLPDNLPPVNADYRRTVQVLVNLLSNALKWGPAGSEILVKIDPVESGVEVSVSDCGPGIPPRYPPRVVSPVRAICPRPARGPRGWIRSFGCQSDR